MAIKERLVDGNVLQGNDALVRIDLHHPVH
jgi:hypothetical protein